MSRLQKSKISQSFSVLIFVLFLIIPAQAQYSGGTGEPNNPYQIATAEDLIALGNEPNDYDKHFIMTADIDLAGYVFDKAVIAPDINDSNYSFDGPPFNGVFDGNFHTISNLNIQGSEYAGLFGIINEGEIRNLGIIDVNIVSGRIEGGLTALNKGSILNCYSTGSINGAINIGGLVGINEILGSIKMCYSICNVVDNSRRASVGGLVGYNRGEISDSYSQGQVYGMYSTGGLVGDNKSLLINRCYSTGQVTSHYMYDGGLTGEFSVVFDSNNSFWDIESSGQVTSSGGRCATTSQMQDPNIFRAAGWDFAGMLDGPSDIWAIPENGGYPILWWQLETLAPLPVFSGGSGTETDPYLITTVNDLNNIASNTRLMDKYFKLTQDINFANKQFYSIGFYCRFNGVFDGNGHIISNFKGTSNEVFHNACLFYEVGYNGIIKNLGVEDVNIIGGNEYIGALVGTNFGIVINSYSTGNIFSAGGAGGLIGSNNGAIQNCYSKTNVTGPGDPCLKGGLVGQMSGSIRNCYSIGQIPDLYHGGLVGDSKIRRPIILSSFWDIETSNQTKSYGGTGLVTAQMQTKYTFTNAGWDFAGETTNGTEDIWTICEGTNYPRFVWQISEGDLVCPDGIAMEDFDFFMDHWGDTNCDSSNNYCEGTDLNFSGTVDINDFEILIYNWLGENP